MPFAFKPLGLTGALVATACSTTTVSDRSAVNSRPALRAPASEISAWANVPGFIDPNAPELLKKDPGLKIDPRDQI